MSILYLIIAGACELGFIIFLKKSDGFKNKKEGILSVIIMGTGLYLLSLATRTIRNRRSLRNLDRNWRLFDSLVGNVFPWRKSKLEKILICRHDYNRGNRFEIKLTLEDEI